MVEVVDKTPTQENLDELKKTIRKLNSKAGQMKMDLHDLAEGLPNDYTQLIEVATKTYEIFDELDKLKKQYKTWEQQLKA